EINPTFVLHHVQRTNAYAIAREDEPSLARVPDRDRPLAVHATKTLRSPRAIGGKDHFGVAIRSEFFSQRFELCAELDPIEDLTVERDPDRTVARCHRLLAGFQIDDREARVCETDRRVPIDPLLVGTAMKERAGHAKQLLTRRRLASTQRCDPAEPAHSDLPLARRRELDIAAHRLDEERLRVEVPRRAPLC